MVLVYGGLMVTLSVVAVGHLEALLYPPSRN